MKRIISIILALAMIIAVLPSLALAEDTSSFNDVTGNEYYADAAEALAKLNILTGYPDGSFGADKSITRAEMATIICRMIGKESDANNSKGTTKFDDVPADHWASGYINIAAKEDIINGNGDGTFKPDNDVKYEEAIKMVVCAVGLGDDVKTDPNDWSVGYIKAAEDNGITENLKGRKGLASTRGDIAVMVYNGLRTTVASPIASVQAGTYYANQSVTLKSDTEGAKIYYTTDGTEPTVNSKEYTAGGINISSTTTLKAIAVKNNVIISDVMSVEYTIVRSTGGGGGGGGSTSGTTRYNVTFDLNYEGAKNPPATQKIKKNNYAERPDDPEREGYVFTGWYTDEDCTEEFDFENTKITKKITLYAGWRLSTEAEEYFADTAEKVTEVIDVKDSPDVQTEAEVKEILEGRGLQNFDKDGNLVYPITYDYNLNAEYIGDTVITGSTTEKHPIYQTIYKSKADELWVINVINGEIFANPLSFNFGTTGLDVEVLVIEKSNAGKLTSYDSATNHFYVTIPKESAILTKTVDNITAETLDIITIDSLCEQTGATRMEIHEDESNDISILGSDVPFDSSEVSVQSSTGIMSADDNDPVIVVSLGDSYSSGEGIPPFYGQNKPLEEKIVDDNWLAHRSTKSWPSLIEIPGIDGTMSNYRVEFGDASNAAVQWYFGAVSGAETKHFKKEQQSKSARLPFDFWHDLVYNRLMPYQINIFNSIDRLSVDYVTLTIGGNDVNFTGIVTQCAVGCAYLYVGSTSKLEDDLNKLWNNIESTMGNIEEVYETVEANAPKAAIIVAGYPKLFNKDGKGFPINKKEATLVNKKVSDFNDKIEELIKNLHNSGMDIHFVDVESAFDGHEAYSDDAWINPIIIGTRSEDINYYELASSYSIHPNEKGAKAYAEQVNSTIRSIEEGNKTLSGVITIADTDTDMTNNLPLEGAKISLNKSSFSASATSGVDGRYMIDGLSPGTYTISVTKTGYIPIEGTVTIADNTENTYNAMVESISRELFDGEGTAAGTIYDVLTGRGIPELTLNIRSGINVTDGDIVTTIKTNENGSYATPSLEAGNYSVEVLDERTLDNEDARYLTSVFVIKVLGNHLIPNQDGYVTNGLQTNQLRIVLKWGEKPEDLDSHLVGPTTNGENFHTYYRNQDYYESSTLIANLDLDDTNSYGPETTTIYEMAPGVYTFMIHDYTNRDSSNSNALANSGAYVEVYLGVSTTASYTFYVPSGDGTLWTVFNYDSNTGTLTPINTMEYHNNPDTIDGVNSANVFMTINEWPDNNNYSLKDYELNGSQDTQKDDTNVEIPNAVNDGAFDNVIYHEEDTVVDIFKEVDLDFIPEI